MCTVQVYLRCGKFSTEVHELTGTVLYSICASMTDLLMNFSNYIEPVDWPVNSAKIPNKSEV
jgi:hypothetical protein